MKLLQMCDETPASVTPETTVTQAIRIMLDRSVGAVAVLDAEHRVAGIFTERDVLRKVALSGREPRTMMVDEVMTRAVEMATPETTAAEALSAMVDSHFRHLPIVDNDGHLLGMLSIRNLLQARIDDLTHQLDTQEQFANDSPGG
jgi:CBS domain-containing protein